MKRRTTKKIARVALFLYVVAFAIAFVWAMVAAGAAGAQEPYTAHSLAQGEPLRVIAIEQGGGPAQRACLYSKPGADVGKATGEEIECLESPTSPGQWAFERGYWEHDRDYWCRLSNASGRSKHSNKITTIDSSIGLRCGREWWYDARFILWCAGRGDLPWGCKSLRRWVSLFDTGC